MGLTQGRPRPVHRPYLVRRRPTSLVLPGKDPPTGALLIAKVLHEICTRCGGDFTDPRLQKGCLSQDLSPEKGTLELWSRSRMADGLYQDSSILILWTSQAFTGLCYACR